MKRKSLLVSSLMTMMLCGSLIAGATYSLFTSESTHNITVSSGKVEVQSTIENMTLSSMGENQPGNTFANGGTATISEGRNLVLDKMTPGDKVSVQINIKNLSNVTVRYRVALKCQEGFKLFSALNINFDALTDFKTINPVVGDNPGETSTLIIELPEDTANEFQGLSTSLTIAVEALQGNAPLPNIIDNSFSIDEGSAPINQSAPTEMVVESEKGAATITVPAVRVDTAKQNVTLKVENVPDQGKFTFENDVYSSYYDITVDGIVAEEVNKEWIKVSFFVGKGLSNVKVYHYDEASQTQESCSYINYDPSTGYVSFKTRSFSPYAVTADKNGLFETTNDPIADAKFLQKALDEYSFVKLNSDLTLNSTADALLTIDKESQFDLNGYKITFNVLDNATENTSLFNVASNFKIINNKGGSIESVKTEGSNKELKTSIFTINGTNTPILTLDDDAAIYKGSPYITKAIQGKAFIQGGIYDLSDTQKAADSTLYSEMFYRDLKAAAAGKTNSIEISTGSFTNMNPYKVTNESSDGECWLEPNRYVVEETNEAGETIYVAAFNSTFVNKLKTSPTYKLTSDVYATYYQYPKYVAAFSISSKGDYSLDLNGHNMYFAPSSREGAYKVNPDIVIAGFYVGSTGKWSTNTFTILDSVGTANVISERRETETLTSGYTFHVSGSYSTLNVNSGKYVGYDTVVNGSNGLINITGGYFDMTEEKKASKPSDAKYIINCIDDDYKAGKIKINMTGGKVVGFDPMNNPEGAVAPEGAAAGVVYGANAYVPVTHETREVVGEPGTYEVILKQQPAQ